MHEAKVLKRVAMDVEKECVDGGQRDKQDRMGTLSRQHSSVRRD